MMPMRRKHTMLREENYLKSVARQCRDAARSPFVQSYPLLILLAENLEEMADQQQKDVLLRERS